MTSQSEPFLVIADGEATGRSRACQAMRDFLRCELGADTALETAAPMLGAGAEPAAGAMPEQMRLVRLTMDPGADMGPEAFRVIGDAGNGCSDGSGKVGRESYRGLPGVRILAETEAGLLYGVEEVIAHHRLHHKFPDTDRAFSPAFAVRGMKGLHWNPDDYLSILDFLPSCKFNFLMLCYGMLPEHCRRFRDPYSREHLEAILRMVEGARERFVTVCVAVNPSLRSVPPARYSGDEDLRPVVDKFKESYELGVRCFALALDDISLDLQRPEDRAAYRSLGDAHADFTCRLRDALLSMDSSNRLILCPTTYFTYHARAYPDYTRAIADGIPEDVEFFWTGPDWNSTSITYEDACEYAELVGRKPFLWLNYPVNDYLKPEPWRLVLAPTAMRCARLPNMLTGAIANPMRQVETSKLPLWSIGRYFWDPRSYDPDIALEEACAAAAAEHGCSPETLLAIARAYIGAYDPLANLADLVGPDSGATPNALCEAERRLRQASHELRQLLPGLRAQLGEGKRLWSELEQGLGRFLNFADAFIASRCAERLGESVRRCGLGSDSFADALHFARAAVDLLGSLWT